MAIRRKTLRKQALSLQSFLDKKNLQVSPLLFDVLKLGYFDEKLSIEEANVYFQTLYKESFIKAYKKKYPTRRAVYEDQFGGMSIYIPFDTEEGKQAYKQFCKQFGIKP